MVNFDENMHGARAEGSFKCTTRGLFVMIICRCFGASTRQGLVKCYHSCIALVKTAEFSAQQMNQHRLARAHFQSLHGLGMLDLGAE